MISGAKAAAKQTGDGKPLLHGSDVSKKRNITITVTGVREAPDNFNAAIILDIEKIGEAEAWAVNKSNLKQIMDQMFPGEADPDLERLIGQDIVLDVAPANNPQTKETVPSLYVSQRGENKPIKKKGR
jgi:hypothetical protein